MVDFSPFGRPSAGRFHRTGARGGSQQKRASSFRRALDRQNLVYCVHHGASGCGVTLPSRYNGTSANFRARAALATASSQRACARSFGSASTPLRSLTENHARARARVVSPSITKVRYNFTASLAVRYLISSSLRPASDPAPRVMYIHATDFNIRDTDPLLRRSISLDLTSITGALENRVKKRGFSTESPRFENETYSGRKD